MMDVLLPAAEANGITMCLHPSDPPVECLCAAARLVCRLSDYDEIFQSYPQKENKMLFCMGTIQEMSDTEDLTGALIRYGKEDRVGYIHLRNVSGKVPCYREEFPDQGDVDVLAAAKAITELGFQGVLLPDHTPEMTVKQPWQTGMAYAVGYWKGIFQAAEGYI